MRNLLRCRRGSAAFATVVALVPLIGAVALGTEAGSWYVTKQRAQNAADAAAYSGGLALACSIGAQYGTPCADTDSVAYRGKEFAAQNSFCNAGDTSYPGSECLTKLPAGTSQAVQIDIGTYNVSSSPSWTSTATGQFVRVTVSQQQPAYLAAVLGLSNVNIGAQAIAHVNLLPKPPCVLALKGSISFQGSPNIDAPNCGMASNDTANNALDFTGGGMSINLGSLSAAGGCAGKSTFCGSAKTYMPAVTNPFSALDATTMPTLSSCKGSSLTVYTAANPCTNNNVKLTGNSTLQLNGGVYFISGTLTLTGNSSIAGTALFILLPGASVSMKGGGTINITGNPSVASSQVPAAFQKFTAPSCATTTSCLFNDMAIYDQSSTGLSIGGNSDISFNGNMYVPNAAVTFQGNPTVNACGQLIAQSIAFNGNATFDNTGCSSNFGTPTPASQYVLLVQ
jgi:hypothetical protein